MTDLLVSYQQKRHIFYLEMKKKLCFCGREDRAARRMYPRIPIDRGEPSFQIGSAHMGTGTSDLQV